jgi:CRP/FNR family transcriptional regulator, transcriptional activator FtrB
LLLPIQIKRELEMRAEEIERVRDLALFKDVDQTLILELLRPAYLQRFPAQVELVREGDPADFLHVVVDGQIEVFAAFRDRETTFSIHGPGYAFIVAAVILDRVYLKSARTLKPSTVLLIPADAVRRAFALDPVFSRALALELALDYRSVVKELKNQKLRTGLERLANWVLARNRETGSSGSFAMPFDKKVLAAHLGMAPEVLSRSFGHLSKHGLKVDGPTIGITNLKSLEKFARPTPAIDSVEI